MLDTTPDNVPRFITKKWIEVHDQSGSAEDRYKPSKQIRFKTSMLRSDLCDFSDAYIVVKGTITVTNPDNAKRNKSVAFKNNAPFINCILKINTVKIIEKQKVVCGIITEMSLIILLLIITMQTL